ncbi:MAG: 2-amino-4-hydroxy-6-hydroxymethyldihydropteridine diphosphokinase [Gammaproteobacteria bacterium]|jgi:2-amino-4-hydroxy-6-hydroxymethyldihydropteridine diphosphokinase
MTVRAYIGLGSNLDNPVAQVLEAVEELEMIPDTILAARSSLYSGRPMGPEEQPDYVNAVVALDTLLSADELHRALVSIEDQQGRARDGEKWGPRIIDLDLLLYGNSTIDTDTLTVPHPGMHERDFVIVPLEEIAGNVKIPGKGFLYSLINKCKSHSLKKLITA